MEGEPGGGLGTPLLDEGMWEGPRATHSRCKTVVDGLGSIDESLVPIDVIKQRFFFLGLQTGVGLQMFGICIIMMMVASNAASGAMHQLTASYYPLFRLFLCFLNPRALHLHL